ncbi:MAG: hypothetical protein RBT63_04990 [Bdellovibrionales bacterium]|jgi:hypothetical protein|nr:hypothetical protein [Bdellovibrionales bacterium]
MPKFKVESNTGLNQTDAYTRIKSMLENDQDLKKMDSSCTFSFNDAKQTGLAKGSKFTADLKVTAVGAGSNVTIEVDLPLMLTPVKGIVQSTLEKKLQKALA